VPNLPEFLPAIFSARSITMKAAQAIARNTPVWVWHDGWWAAVVVEPCSGTDEMLVVRLAHGVSVPASLAALEPRDPALLGNDRPAEHRRDTKVNT
jgi:hypothetical protein